MLKKIISLGLTAAMTLPMMAMSASAAVAVKEPAVEEPIVASAVVTTPAIAPDLLSYADDAEETSKKLEEMIVRVKERLAETDAYDTFNYNNYSYGTTTQMYHLEWSDSKGKLPMLYAGVMDTGLIVSFEKYEEYTYSDTPILPELTKKDAIAVGLAFIEKVLPEMKDDFGENFVQISYNANRGTYQITYYRSREGVRIDSQSLSVIVSGKGEVISYNAQNLLNVTGDTPTKSVSEDEIKKAFRSGLDLELHYHNIYNSETGKNEVQLSYLQKANEFVVSAMNGSRMTLIYDGRSGYKYAGGVVESPVMEEAAADKVSVNLSAAEQKAVDTQAQYVNASDIRDALIADERLAFDERYTIASTSTYASESNFTDEITYFMNIRLEHEYGYARVVVNAETGEIKSFYSSNYNDTVLTDEMLINLPGADAYQADIDAYLAENYDFSGEFKCENTEWLTGKEAGRYGSYSYQRYVNNIPYDNNYISVTVDRLTGIITSLTVEYSKDAEFVNPKTAISMTKALGVYVDALPLEKTYLSYLEKTADSYTVSAEQFDAREVNLALIYTYNFHLMVNAITGEVFTSTYDPKPVEYTPVTYYDSASYIRIKDHANSLKLETLFNMGYIAAEKGFKPDNNIKTSEFMEVIRNFNYTTYRNYVNDENYNPDAELSRSEAIVIMIDMLGYGDIAKINDIFTFDFETYSTADKKLTGYYAIAMGLGLLEDFGIDLDLKAKTTYSDMASMVYNYLMYLATK